MHIVLNGEKKELPDNSTVKTLIERFDLKEKGVAVAVNMTFVPVAEYDKRILKEGDEVEVLAPVYGG